MYSYVNFISKVPSHFFYRPFNHNEWPIIMMKMSVLWMGISSISCWIRLYRFYVVSYPFFLLLSDQNLNYHRFDKKTFLPGTDSNSDNFFSLLLLLVQLWVISLIFQSLYNTHIPYFHSCNVYISRHQCWKISQIVYEMLFGQISYFHQLWPPIILLEVIFSDDIMLCCCFGGFCVWVSEFI